MKPIHLVALLALTVSGCATAPKDFYANPDKAKDTALCRALMETKDAAYQRDLAAELVSRNVTAQECENKVAMENAAIVGIAAVATGVAVVAACQNGCGSSRYVAPSYSASDYDCAGGRGDGPLYQYGPVYVGSYDPNRLDADGDGMGCEASDVAYGS